MEYVDKVPFSDETIKIEKEAKYIMEQYFDNIENRFEIDFMIKLTKNINVDKVLNVHQQEVVIAINNKHYDYMISREKHLENMKDKDKDILLKDKEYKHIEAMKDKDKDRDIELKKIELEMKNKDIELKLKEKDKDIKLKKIELEMKKLDFSGRKK
jgi:hypothetical protein